MTTYLVSRTWSETDTYITADSRADAYRTAAAMPACHSCGLRLGPSGAPRVTFEHGPSAATAYRDRVPSYVYLTVTCLTCAPVVWARLQVAAEARELIAA